jgi:hypothetical protein
LERIDNFGKKDRDGIINSSKGFQIEEEKDSQANIFYSKLDIVGSLLDVYDEPQILSLAYRLGKTDKFDVSQIHKYLHQAVYLPNNAAYVDQMLLPKKVLQFESTDIVSMYCYLFCEVKLQLKESVSTEITSLSERFREKYLRSSDSLFDEQSYEQVLDILKDALETIDHNTPIKDADYWQYYEAIELFLYGDLNKEEDGEIWGISNFHSVWESMCLTYIIQNIDQALPLHLDTRYISNLMCEKFSSLKKPIDLSNTFKINQSQLVPDAVVFLPIVKKVQSRKDHYQINNGNWVDFNYKTFIKKGVMFKSKTAYVGQKKNIHTIDKLQEFYPLDSHNSVTDLVGLNITHRLPKIFYSYWKVPETILVHDLSKMHYFNHFFYIALEKDITDWDSFDKQILKPLDINFDMHLSSIDPKSNVFTHSLFRDKATSSTYSSKYIKDEFTRFIKQALDFNKIEIIDIKYLTADHFGDSSNINDIKSKSIRKQFVYEYLLQKNLEARKDEFSNLTINSSFWLPIYQSHSSKLLSLFLNLPHYSDLIRDGETFMDGYIQLKNINFELLAENYIA